MGESVKLRNFLLENSPILDVIAKITKQPILSENLTKTLSWIACNISRFKNLSFEQVKKCMEVVNAALFTNSQDIESDALWAMSYLVDTSNDE